MREQRITAQAVGNFAVLTIFTLNILTDLSCANSGPWSNHFKKKFHHCAIFLQVSQQFNPFTPEFWLIVLGFIDTSTLVVILCRLPEKGRRKRRNSRGDEREGQGRKSKMNESEEIEEIKNIHFLPIPAAKIEAFPNRKPILVGCPGDARYKTPLPHLTTPEEMKERDRGEWGKWMKVKKQKK